MSVGMILVFFGLGISVPVLHHSPIFNMVVSFISGFIHERLFGN